MRFSFLFTVLTAGLVAAAPVSSPFATQHEKQNTPLNTVLSIILENLPTVQGAVEAVENVIIEFNTLISKLTGISTTYNELGGACKDYTVIFARGTDDPGNVGVLTGPPFFMALKSLVGSSKVTVQGVNNYAASAATYLAGGDPAGINSMASEIKAAYAACPNTKLVASGYSQGGLIIHKSIALLPAATAKWISSVVIFGDPYEGHAISNVDASKVKTFCNARDKICENGVLILPAHLTYGLNAADAAAFVTR